MPWLLWLPWRRRAPRRDVGLEVPPPCRQRSRVWKFQMFPLFLHLRFQWIPACVGFYPKDFQPFRPVHLHTFPSKWQGRSPFKSESYAKIFHLKNFTMMLNHNMRSFKSNQISHDLLLSFPIRGCLVATPLPQAMPLPLPALRWVASDARPIRLRHLGARRKLKNPPWKKFCTSWDRDYILIMIYNDIYIYM